MSVSYCVRQLQLTRIPRCCSLLSCSIHRIETLPCMKEIGQKKAKGKKHPSLKPVCIYLSIICPCEGDLLYLAFSYVTAASSFSKYFAGGEPIWKQEGAADEKLKRHQHRHEWARFLRGGGKERGEVCNASTLRWREGGGWSLYRLCLCEKEGLTRII